LALAFAVPCAMHAADGGAITTTAPPIINSVCPMDGKAIDAGTSPTVKMTVGEGSEAKQYRMAMCSQSCCTEFKKDPAVALKREYGKLAPGPKTNDR